MCVHLSPLTPLRPLGAHRTRVATLVPRSVTYCPFPVIHHAPFNAINFKIVEKLLITKR